ncbi:DNA mismatch repair endonuclease MutL [Patescibacteria group bacterium]
MSIIKILPENLVNQIAAGEVVERPASVVKELLENSIDAGATRITLEVTGAGDEMIKITDNGSGMDRDDARLAFERHATSKISSKDDLFNISSLGFRGEAIASIASVSHVVLKTKRREDSIGTLISCIGGEIEKNEDVSCSDGTQIEIRNLFYNTPARKKYLKTPSTEYQHVIAVFQGITLMHPEVHFKLIHNEKASFEYPKVGELIDRVRDVLGKNVSENLLPIFYGGSEIQLQGFIGKPELSRKGSKHQYLFVNDRHINHHLFSYALAEAYHSLLMDGKKPFYLINIKINPALIDVNVHPRKLEIRFQNQNELFKILSGAAKKTLEKNVLMPSFREHRTHESPSENQIKAVLDFTQKITGGAPEIGRLNKYSYKQEEPEELSMKPLTQIAKSYILAENEEGLVLIDQHAAHERVRYEELINQLEKKSPEKQQLLLPLEIELSALEVEMFENNKKVFEDLGFEIESFGGNTFIIHAVPSPISNENIQNILQEVLADLSDDKSTRAVKNPQEKVLEYMACRSAIKFGKDLSYNEMVELIKQVDKLKRPYTCPHGRPSMVKLTYHELEKMFKRK